MAKEKTPAPRPNPRPKSWPKDWPDPSQLVEEPLETLEEIESVPFKVQPDILARVQKRIDEKRRQRELDKQKSTEPS